MLTDDFSTISDDSVDSAALLENGQVDSGDCGASWGLNVGGVVGWGWSSLASEVF